MSVRIPRIAILLLLIACLAMTGCEFLLQATLDVIFDLDDDDCEEYCFACGSYHCSCGHKREREPGPKKDPRPGDTKKLRS